MMSYDREQRLSREYRGVQIASARSKLRIPILLSAFCFLLSSFCLLSAFFLLLSAF
jgi:hypothetical protein